MLKKIKSSLSHFFSSSEIPDEFLPHMSLDLCGCIFLILIAIILGIAFKSKGLTLACLILAGLVLFDYIYFFYIGTKNLYMRVHGIVISGNKKVSFSRIEGFIHNQKMITFKDMDNGQIFTVMMRRSSNEMVDGAEFDAIIPTNYILTRDGTRQISRFLSHQITNIQETEKK